MAQIDWQDTLSVGNDTIDRQHRKWIELYNTFDRVMTDNSPHEAQSSKLDALQLMHEYMLYHFRYEEMLMANHGYPGLAQHWRQHKDFDYKLFAYIRRLETDRLVSRSEILDMLHKWLVEHIQQEDQQMQRYLEEKSHEQKSREEENPQ
jgi:hemerythrin